MCLSSGGVHIENVLGYFGLQLSFGGCSGSVLNFLNDGGRTELTLASHSGVGFETTLSVILSGLEKDISGCLVLFVQCG